MISRTQQAAAVKAELEALGPFLLRAAEIGVKTTWLIVATGMVFTLAWQPGQRLESLRLGTILLAGGCGAAIVSKLPWRRLIDRGQALGAFHLWSVVNILLVTMAIDATGAGRSDLFAVYGLTTIFFASVFPRRDQLGLLALTILSYLSVVALHSWDAEPSTFVIRIGFLSMTAFLGSFLSGELRSQVFEHRKQSLHDPLTGLANRLLFTDRAQQAIALAERHDHKSALLVLDLDGFKEINDSLGHAAGDRLLVQIAERFTGGIIRQTDTVARLGGDEFAVLLPKIVGRRGAVLPAARLIQAMNEPFDLGDAVVGVRASVGIAIYPDHAMTVDDLFQKADIAMYHSKESRSPFEVSGDERTSGLIYLS